MANHMKTAAFATLAMAGMIAAPAGAALNASAAPAVTAQDFVMPDVSTPAAAQLAIASATPDQIAAILQAAIQANPSSAAALLSQAATANPTLAGQLASVAVRAGMNPALAVAVASSASGVSIVAVAIAVAGSDSAAAQRLVVAASQVTPVQIASATLQTPTGSISPTLRFTPPTPGIGGSGNSPEPVSTNALQGNGGNLNGSGPNASPT